MKIGIIGAGRVGENIASQLICGIPDISKIIFIDIDEKSAKGKALDLTHMASVYNKDILVEAYSSYENLVNMDYVIMTAGVGKDIEINSKIVYESSKNIAKYSPNAVIIMVTNPLDIMVYVAYKASGFDKSKVIGMAGELKTARFRHEISTHFNLPVSSVCAFVIGDNSNSSALSDVKIDGETKEINKSDLDEIYESAKKSAEKVKELNQVCYFAPSAGVTKMIRCMSENSDETLSCSIIDEDEIPTGKVIKLCKTGIDSVLDLDYGDSVEQSKKATKEQIDSLKLDF